MTITRPRLAFVLTCAVVSMAQAQSVPPGRTSVLPVVNASLVNEVLLRGQTQPVSRVEIHAAIRGILAEVNVKEGQSVKKGEAMVKLDDSLQKQKVEFERVSAEGTAEVKYAENQLEYAKNELDLLQRLSSPPLAELQQKQLAVKQAMLSLEAAKDKQAQSQAKYKEELITLQLMTLTAPIDGYVMRVNKEVGEQTDENPVVVVVQTSKLTAVFYPPKELFGKIAEGDKVAIDFEGQKREGRVVAVDPIIDPASQIFRIKLEVDNADGSLAAGVNATAIFTKK